MLPLILTVALHRHYIIRGGGGGGGLLESLLRTVSIGGKHPKGCYSSDPPMGRDSRSSAVGAGRASRAPPLLWPPWGGGGGGVPTWAFGVFRLCRVQGLGCRV